MSLWLVVPAAGSGRRFGGDVPKQYQLLAGRPVIVHTLERLLTLSPTALVVVLAEGDPYWDTGVADGPTLRTVTGGAERADSVRAALAALADEAEADDWVLVHDVARPCVTESDLQSLVSTLRDHPVGGLLATPVSDTLKRVEGQQVEGTQDRDGLWAGMTPQMFRYGLLCKALDAAATAGVTVTDESAAVEALGLQPQVVPGRRDNIKITRREDIAIAEAILAFQRQELE